MNTNLLFSANYSQSPRRLGDNYTPDYAPSCCCCCADDEDDDDDDDDGGCLSNSTHSIERNIKSLCPASVDKIVKCFMDRTWRFINSFTYLLTSPNLEHTATNFKFCTIATKVH